jgi:hypothetical protein
MSIGSYVLAYYLYVFVWLATPSVLFTVKNDEPQFKFTPNSYWISLADKILQTNEMLTCTNDMTRCTNAHELL